ncbi:5'-nucleotidase C-terminal domain-containing protein [Neotabrizicola shimadae]|uniref:5'-nucleotidase C-terminal domain-containing protein n=1 Tax=Neotabrizicola shimadae TaxID=2807096 RepID=A0A8G1EDQ2_9RHOB|nr:5'-nucleotidase C-terminal domain-containing protein [Neotabrizicola shimadae]QYZ70436.1 5'-nucleotidase C-terminal domain-containing protein [Neotabrizicola shimadae]
MSDSRPVNCEPQGAKEGTRLRLRILATTDLHGHLLPWNYDHARPAPGTGLAALARLIQDARREEPNSILVDNGDFLQGTALTDLAPSRPGPNPVIAAMNRLGYAAASLGNHEFSLGLPHLEQALSSAAFPFLSANLVRCLGPSPLEDRPFTEASVLLDLQPTDRHGTVHALRLGIIGFTPPQTLVWDGDSIGHQLSARGILEAARAHVPALRRAGADLVLALCHAGLGADTAADGSEDVATALAAQGGIDAMVAGHSHRSFPDLGFPLSSGVDPRSATAAGVPTVMPGFAGSHLGLIDLDLERGPAGWRVRRSRAGLRTTAGPTDPGLAALAAPHHARTLSALDQPVGFTHRRLHSHFDRIADSAALHLVAEAQAAHVRAHLTSGPLAGVPVLAAVAPFKTGGRGGPQHVTDIPAGPLLRRHVFDLYTYPNRIAALLLTGQQVADWLEHGARQFLTLSPGSRDGALIDPEVPSFAFDTIPALRWTVDPSAPPGARIRGLTYRDRPIHPAGRFVLATNSYRASGSGGFPGAEPQNRIPLPEAPMQEVLLAHLSAGPVPWHFTPSWRLADLPGTSALVTAPEGALDLIAQSGLALSDAGPAPDGFRLLRIAL